ncbi:hypothetical protein GC176_22875 [bacterium]|nr:hypothetical protein [bacterium]
MPVDTAPDLFLISLLGGGIVVAALVIFWFLGSRHSRVVVATLVAFLIAVAFGVIIQIRTDQTAAMRRIETEARLKTLERDLLEQQRRQEAERQQLEPRIQDDRLPDDRAGRELAPVAVTSTDVSTAWLPEVDEQFEADVYPSAELAGRALIRDWAGHLDKILSKGVDRPVLIRLTSQNRTPDIDELAILEAMDELVRKQFPEAGTLVTTTPEPQKDGELKAGEVTIELSVSQFVSRKRGYASAAGRGNSTEISGTLRADFKGHTWRLSHSTRFVEKPWLTSTSEFLSLRHGTTYLVLRCSQLASSAEEASRDVLEQAASRLGFLIDPRRNQGLPRPASLIMLEQLEAGKYIADRFVQKLKRPYGEVYREAILLDIGATNLQDMIQASLKESRQYAAASQRQTARRVDSGLGILIVVGSLTALYLLLNWLTKGYYRGPLTVALCLAGSGAIAAVILALTTLA